jgi:fructose-1,6-bisphosphatase I
MLAEANEWGGKPAAMASREMDRPLGIPVVYPHCNCPLPFDSIDGTSNIDIDVSIGTVFSVLPAHDSRAQEAGLLQAGTN